MDDRRDGPTRSGSAPAGSVDASVIDGLAGAIHPPDDSLALQVLVRACELAGFDWRGSGLTLDEAIDALPDNLADTTVRLMRESYLAADDETRTSWADAKLDTIGLRRLRRTQLHVEEQDRARAIPGSTGPRDTWTTRVAAPG